MRWLQFNYLVAIGNQLFNSELPDSTVKGTVTCVVLQLDEL